jgi:hypothetical protein
VDRAREIAIVENFSCGAATKRVLQRIYASIPYFSIVLLFGMAGRRSRHDVTPFWGDRTVIRFALLGNDRNPLHAESGKTPLKEDESGGG